MKYIQPLKISKRQSGRVKKEGMTAFHALTPVWMDELRKTGHGGEWGPERYRDDGPVIYASEANDTKKIGIVEAMNRVADEKKVFILPTTKSISIKQNPEMDWVDVRKSTEAVEMYENKELMNSLYPDLGELTLATMMQERGPFRASFEAQSGKGVPYGSNVKVTGETNKRIRAQVLGIQPTSAEKLSAKQTKELRRRIRSRIYSKYANFIKEKAEKEGKDPEEYLQELKSGISEIGATEESLMEAILSGHHKYIDRSETTVNDFQRMVSGYTQIRRANGPFLKKIMPKLSQGMKSLELFEGFNTKFLDAIAPTADYMLQPGVIHAIIDIEGKVVTPNDIWESSFLRLLTGESLTQVSDPAYVKADLNKAAYRFLASHDHNTEAAAKAILMASRNAFLSDKGVIDIGIKILQVDKISDAIDKANSDRVGSKPFTKIFEIDSPNIKKRNEIMQNLVSRGLAFPIPTSKKMNKKMSKEKKVEYSGKGSAFFLVPLFSSGFTKQPKGWDSRWVVPTFQILEEYSDVMKGGSMPSALELLYMIATRAKAIYDYEINESETMLLYSMLDPHDPKGDQKSPMQLLEEDIEKREEEKKKLKRELSTTKGQATKAEKSKEEYKKQLEEEKKARKEIKEKLEETEKLLTAKKGQYEALKAAELNYIQEVKEEIEEERAAAEDLFGPITPVVRKEIVVPEPFQGSVRAPSDEDVKAAFSNPAFSNPPANILPTGVSPSDLGDPFNEAHAEYIFKLLTRKATAAVTEKREKLVNKLKDVMSPGEFKKLDLEKQSNEDLENLITKYKPKTKSGDKPKKSATQGFAFSGTGAGLKDDSDVEVDGKTVKFETIKDDNDKMTKVLLAMGHTYADGQWKKATTTSRAGLSMAPPSVVKASSKKDAISQRELLLQEGFDYKVMVKGKNYLLASESSIGEAERKGYKVVSIDSFMGPKAMTMRRSKTNPPKPGLKKIGDGQFKSDLQCERCGWEGSGIMDLAQRGADMAFRSYPSITSTAPVWYCPECKMPLSKRWAGIPKKTYPNPRGLSRTLAKAAAETRASKLNKTIYCVKGEDKKWHIKESRPNSGEYFEVKPNPNDEGIIRSEMMEPVWKMRVRYILDQEGGASGLAPLMEAFPKGTTNKEARKMLTKIHDVRKHRSGDYIWENPEDKLKCTYRKTKRSKPCGSEVKMMRNGRLYKCGKCGAKYEMR